MLPSARMRSIGWAVVLTVCIALFVGLTFQVNSVKSQVRLAERRIVSLEREKLLLETEFETRASQHQLANWNTVEFGYRAPRADQFLENERQLASLGTPPAIGAPDPIRVASADVQDDGGEAFPAMVSPLTGKAFAAEVDEESERHAAHRETLSGRLTRGAARIVISAGAEVAE
ncbi:hypothetical protein NT2_05_03940 [Caenibius tardaugens NBRC 16725]|uniref:Uncharacterized protein n=1 Tax=Caenibius tardaugens NBRC 16725 TaxID=1219035 RepID=U3A3Z0_9SPHN|nr:hypothetical protein [Caenibius tardaugens]GAD49473.1 hypothetical protein NT2_05_03940 [Caenibius tardaugens NBRC 16725]